MLKILSSGRRVCRQLRKTIIQNRSFLSDAYRCEEAWKARLQNPILQKFKPEDLFLKLDQSFASSGKVSAVDIDIFVNSIRDKEQIDELLILLENLRRSAETTNTLDSTHYAVTRYLLDNDYNNELMKVLHNRLTYGIIPDNLTYNLLMDAYIKKGDYASAAKVAVLPMLQEDAEHPITNALSIYACFKYLETPDTWQKPPEPVDDSKEEIKIRVAYLRNPYFDDHFDLTDPRDLVGKTLSFMGKAMNNTLGRTCQLRGLILYKKYLDTSKLIKYWLKEVKENLVYEEVFKLIEKDNENISKEDVTSEFENVMSEINALKQNSCTNSLMEALENNVKSAVDKQHDVDVKRQLQLLSEWERQREVVLNKQLEEINRLDRIENIKKIKKDMEKKERLLTFFENEEKIELEIERLEKEEKEEMERILKLPHAGKKLRILQEEAEYVPPKV